MTTPPIQLQIPASNQPDGKLEITLSPDGRVFVVGPNGSGKSALLQHFLTQLGTNKVRRISAHRQTWLGSNAIEMTPKARRDANRQIVNRENQPSARWKDDFAPLRLSAVLFDLVAAENQRAREITHLMDEGRIEEAASRARTSESSFKRLNDLLRAGNMTVQIEAATGEEILAHHVEGTPFSMAQLSDGERNAVILGATVLTVDPGTVLLIDEPERHLHRSIMEPFLVALFSSRSDCPFIVSTHELSLPLAASDAKVLLPRSCQWQGEAPTSWNIDLLESGSELPDDLKESVLGSRKTMLFVEGGVASLDAPIYGLLLPDTTVIAKGPSTAVLRAVEGLRAADDLHWVRSYGLIDRDDRTDDEVTTLEGRGIFALAVHSAEAIYYSDKAMQRMAERQAETLGCTCDKLFDSAITAALTALSDQQTMLRLCARRSERLIRSMLLSQMPTWHDIQAHDEINFHVSIKGIYEEEIRRYEKMCQEGDLNGLISRYSVRETPALDLIAKKLEFTGRPKYEHAVLAMAADDATFLHELRTFIRPLADAISPTPALSTETAAVA